MANLNRQTTALKIHFTDETERCSFGVASVINYEDNKTECLEKFPVLAPPWKNNEVNISRIPNGIYLARKKKATRKFKYEHIEILNVPSRTAILMHRFNWAHESRGCMAVGESYVIQQAEQRNYKINNSTKALKNLLSLLPDSFIIEVL